MYRKFMLHRRQVLLVLVIIVGILLVRHLISIINNPMRLPAPMLRAHILRHTPIGMCMEEVIEIIEINERWGSPITNRSNGFLHPSRFVDGDDGSVSPVVVGVQSVQTRVGIYNMMPFHRRNIRIQWGFDENGKLIEVYVGSTFSPRLS